MTKGHLIELRDAEHHLALALIAATESRHASEPASEPMGEIPEFLSQEEEILPERGTVILKAVTVANVVASLSAASKLPQGSI